MSVKIHHGPHGSFKTAGAIKDDLIPAIRAGRPIVTNVRGITLERIFEAIPEAPESLELFNINTASLEGMEKMARFFHWVPNNAFILVDEAQLVFPKKWRQSDIDALDYPDGFDAAIAADRAPTWDHAWDMERHHNFDIVLTTPNIKKIREDIRGNAEGAFKHKNKGLLSWIFKGSYIEGFHQADDNGTSQSDFLSIVDKRIKSNDPTWQLYESTATGAHRDTQAGINIFTSPRVLLPLGILALAAGFAFSNGLPRVLDPEKDSVLPGNPPAQSVPVSVRQSVKPAVHSDSGRMAAVAFGEAPRELAQGEKLHPFEGSNFRLIGIIEKKGEKQAYFEVDGVFMSAAELVKLQYTLTYLTDCAVALHHGRSHLMATCQSSPSVVASVSDVKAPVASQSPLNVANLDASSAPSVDPSQLSSDQP